MAAGEATAYREARISPALSRNRNSWSPTDGSNFAPEPADRPRPLIDSSEEPHIVTRETDSPLLAW